MPIRTNGGSGVNYSQHIIWLSVFRAVQCRGKMVTGVAADNASAFVDEHPQTVTGARNADVHVCAHTHACFQIQLLSSWDNFPREGRILNLIPCFASCLAYKNGGRGLTLAPPSFAWLIWLGSSHHGIQSPRFACSPTLAGAPIYQGSVRI